VWIFDSTHLWVALPGSGMQTNQFTNGVIYLGDGFGYFVTNSVWVLIPSRYARLNISRQKGQPPKADSIAVSWTDPGLRLQMTPTLVKPAWQHVPNSEGRTNVTLTGAELSAFFRLVGQARFITLGSP